MRCFEGRVRLKAESVSDLTKAYKFLTEPKAAQPEPPAAPLSPDDQAKLEQDIAALRRQTPEVRDFILTTLKDLLEAEEGRPNRDNECWWAFFFIPIAAAMRRRIVPMEEVEELASMVNEHRAEDELKWP